MANLNSVGKFGCRTAWHGLLPMTGLDLRVVNKQSLHIVNMQEFVSPASFQAVRSSNKCFSVSWNWVWSRLKTKCELMRTLSVHQNSATTFYTHSLPFFHSVSWTILGMNGSTKHFVSSPVWPWTRPVPRDFGAPSIEHLNIGTLILPSCSICFFFSSIAFLFSSGSSHIRQSMDLDETGNAEHGKSQAPACS
jgi:hypothetical protein